MWARASRSSWDVTCRRLKWRTLANTLLSTYLSSDLLTSTYYNPSHARHCSRCRDAPRVSMLDKLHVSENNLCLHETHRHHQVWEVLLLNIWPLKTEAGGIVRNRDYTINRTDSAPPLAHSPPHRLISHLSQDIKSSVHPQHPQEFFCKATKMSWLCLSAALLFLLVILVDSTPVYTHHTQDQDRSSLISPLQLLGKL